MLSHCLFSLFKNSYAGNLCTGLKPTLGIDAKPQNINLGLGLAPKEKLAYIRLLRQYKSVFAWNYDELKTYDTSIIHHTIPMLNDEKHVQQKLRKIHPNIENQIKSKLNKLLKAKIIFPV